MKLTHSTRKISAGVVLAAVSVSLAACSGEVNPETGEPLN